MAKKTQEQFSVICDGLFLNDTKPHEWNQQFPWTASVGFHFRALDESGEPTGEVQKKYLNKMWIFQAMGGRNAVGKYFRIEAQHGTIPANDGKPEKHYVTITPLAEVFSDGTARFLEAPKDGKVNVPVAKKDPIKPKLPAGPKPDTASPTKPIAENEQEQKPFVTKDKNLSKIQAFFRELQTPQSDGWWTFKTQIGYEASEAISILDFAKHLTVMESTNFDGDVRECANKALDYWTQALKQRLLLNKFEMIRDRLSHFLTLCHTDEQLDKILYKAWIELPESDFLALRNEAVDRHYVIANETKDGVFTGKITGTLQPEVKIVMGQNFVESKKIEVTQEAQMNITPSDAAVAKFTISSLAKFTEAKKLLEFWNSTTDEIKREDAVKKSFALAVVDMYMRFTDQPEADQFRAALPNDLVLNAVQQEIIEIQYQKLPAF